MPTTMNRTLLAAVMLLAMLLSIATPLLADEQNVPANGNPEPTNGEAAAVSQPTTLERLTELRTETASKRKELDELRRKLAGEKNEENIAHLTQLVNELPKTIESLNNAFDRIALDGVDSSIFSEQPEEKFNWQEELLQITRPVFGSLKELTEKPRKIELLRNDIYRYQQQQEVIDRALASIDTLLSEKPNKEVKTRLKALLEQWQQRRDDTQHALDMAEYQIATLQGETASSWEAFIHSLKGFVTGRGLTLAIAMAAVTLVWLLGHLLQRLSRRIRAGSSTLSRRQRTRERAIGYLYRFATGVMMVIALIAVFYTRSDLLLLALTIIAVIMIVLAMRQTLPRYIGEIRLLLDFGSIREGERTLYNGLPMKVKSINAFAYLRNPELEGIIRLPLAAITDMVSRTADDEPWFPCSTGDFLLFPDSRIAEVLRLTVESAQLRIARSVVNLPIGELLTMEYRNLSRSGFAIPITFGIDYQHQAICLTEIPAKIHQAVDQALRNSEWAPCYSDLLVEFKEAGANSLDYLVYPTLLGAAAGNYYTIARLIQRSLVELCNREGWVIPFTQLTIHQGEGFNGLRAP